MDQIFMKQLSPQSVLKKQHFPAKNESPFPPLIYLPFSSNKFSINPLFENLHCRNQRSSSRMDSTTQKPNPNVYHIGGLPVEFPYKPYGSQLAFMGRVISTLDRGLRQGHCHALLESPTGTGKSLSLLCSALAWQKNYKAKNLYSNLSHSKPNPEAMSDPLACGGGFVPEPEPSSNLEPGNLELDPSSKNSRSKKQKTAPTIFYASRTHSQITQVIREYRKTSYRVPMAVLASRKHYCTNRHVCGKENLDEECKTLLKANKLPGQHQDVGCLEFKNAHKVKAHPSLQRGGCNEVHDIEDLVKVGQLVKGCSYFAARDMSDEAQIVFCPYSYILNPAIRKAMEVDIKESIVILDEAHNIEDIARDAGSVDVEEEVLYSLQTELGELCFTDAMIYQPLYDTIQGIISWIGQRKNTLEKREYQHYFSCWTGDKAVSELQQVGISQQCFPILQECAAKAIKAATDGESEAPHLSGMSVTTLEGLFSALGYFFSGNGLHALDYQLALRRYVKKDAGQTSEGWTQSLSLWCLNPAVVFREIAGLSMSVILTSGTLSPMNSFSSELGVQFETCMEAPHVIDVESQLWAAVVSTGPGNYPLNASYKTADGFAFQDSLGASLEEICKIVPGGALVFFPSYKLMEKLCSRWRETGQWSRLTTQKSLFVEPRGNQGDFESVLKEYYESIRRGNRPAPRKIKREKKRDINHFYAKDTPQYGGAAFLAVCRGKVSEGIDFSDENARVVVLVGIPFPNINDVKVAQKKKYNDTFSSSKNLLSGSQWYCHQAFRAMNQAAGRCIRHRFDYGAIILMDERFREERNIAYVSKWLRKSIKQYDSFDMSMEGLRSFFQDAKERFGQKVTANVENSDFNEESTPSTEHKNLSKGPAKRKVQKCCKLDQPNGPKVVSKNIIPAGKAGQRLLPRSLTSLRNDGATFPKLNAQSIDESKTFTQADEYETGNCRGYNFGCNAHKDSRSESSISMASCDTPGSLSTVKGTPYVSDNIDMSSPTVLSNEVNSNSTIVEPTNEFSDQLSFHSAARANSSGAVTEDTFALGSTPERTINNDICNLKPEMESSLNLSVNSHTEKRRKPVTSSLPNYSEMDKCRTPDAHSPLVECMRRKSVSRDATRRIEFEFEAGPYYKKHSQTCIVNNRDSVSLCSDVAMDQRLHICCSICKNSLGLPENQFLVTCSLTSSSKVYLTSFLESGSKHLSINGSEGIPVVISDISSVNAWLYYNRPIGGSTPKHGIWCEKDGCVFNTVFCPFCTVPNNILGFQVKATDAQNIQLQNKILFYFNSLEIRNNQEPEVECCLPVSGSDPGQSVKGSDIGPVVKDSDCEQDDVPSIEKFRYSTQQPSSGGWRTTRSKLRLPRKRASKTENHYGTQR